MKQIDDSSMETPAEKAPLRSPVRRAGRLSTRLRVSSFDRLVLTVMVGLILGLAATVLLGDRVGVTLARVTPLGTARTTSTVSIQFSEPMERDSVVRRLRMIPDLKGEYTWSGPSVVFRPERPLTPGGEYTVVLERGARSQEGREVLSEYQFSFTVAQPRVAYMAPADGAPQNIWLSSIDDPDSARQVTSSPSGIYDFGVSPDGSQIAFAERNSLTGTSDIKLLDLATGGITQITNCVDSDCTSPVWRPDGRTIAYNRIDYNSEFENVSNSPTRVWLIDLTVTPATTRPLFSDLQILGFSPQWSADGRRISVFNRDEGILVFDFDSNNISAIPSRSGSSSALSPDGTQVVYPEITFIEGQETRSYLNLADLNTQELRNLSTPADPVHDERAAWRPDGQMLAIARRYLDNRYTRGAQVVLMDPDDGLVRQLTEDPRYSNLFFSWDPTGNQLVIQRFQELTDDGQPNPGRPEIWTVNATTGELTQVASNAFHPRWVP